MGFAEELLAVAQSQVGYEESPPDSNLTKYGEWYGMNGQPWCDIFVSWCANEIGQLDAVGKYAYCPYHVNYFKAKGWWLDREEKPQPGDIVFFANKGLACHVGIVEARNGTSSVTTIEGNTSVTSDDNGGSVMRRTRTYGSVGSSWYILGFGRPQYKEEDMTEAFDVWAYKNEDINGDKDAYRLLTETAREVARRDDPSGRNVSLTTHEHVKWMAAKQEEMREALQQLGDMVTELSKEIDQLSDKIDSMAPSEE